MSADKIIQLKPSPRRALLTALVLVAAAGLYRWILAPYNGQLWAAQQYKSALDNALRKTDVLGTTLDAKRAKIEELSKDAARLRDELFTPAEVREFLASLPAVAGRTGCTIQSVSSPAEEQPGLRNQPQDNSGIAGKKTVVTIVGGYGGIVGFLKELQTSEHKVWIESLKIDAGGVGKLKCQISLALYCADAEETTFYE